MNDFEQWDMLYRVEVLVQEMAERIEHLEHERDRLRKSLSFVAGVRDACCGLTEDPLAWCMHDDARAVLEKP